MILNNALDIWWQTLTSYNWRKIPLSRVSSHLTHNIVMILLVQICYFWKSYLVSTILIFKLIEVIFASSNNVHSIVYMSTVLKAVTCNTHQVWWLIWPIPSSYICTRFYIISVSVSKCNLIWRNSTINQILLLL